MPPATKPQCFQVALNEHSSVVTNKYYLPESVRIIVDAIKSLSGGSGSVTRETLQAFMNQHHPAWLNMKINVSLKRAVDSGLLSVTGGHYYSATEQPATAGPSRKR